MHGFLEVDGVQNFQPVAEVQEHFSALGDDAAFGVCDHKADGIFLGCALHQIRLQPKSRLAGAGTADNQHVFISCCARVSRAVVHGQAFRLGENDVVLKGWVNIGGNVGGGSPAGRAVFLIVPELLGVPPFDIYSQPHGSGNADANA